MELLVTAGLVICGVAAALWLYVALLMTTGREVPGSWSKKWPPISDDEFMARCKPGTSRKVALKVRAIVAEQLGVPYEQVYPEQNFVRDLWCD